MVKLKSLTRPSAGADMEQQELSGTPGRDEKMVTTLEKQFTQEKCKHMFTQRLKHKCL